MTYSPLLAIITGIIELAAAAWIFLGPRLGRKRIIYPIGLIFLLLAGYQFAEVGVCSRPDLRFFTRLAFFDITWLPPLALWLGSQISRPKLRWLRAAAVIDFGAALALSVWIFADPRAVTKSVCQTVIAFYAQARTFEVVYGIFYQFSLLLTIFAGVAAMALSDDSVLRKHWANLQGGILGFLLPSIAVRILVFEKPGTLPSVMCHFALILAVSLGFLALRERRHSPSPAGAK
jgi:hypothetical protein